MLLMRFLLTGIIALICANASAQYPTKPIAFVIPFAAGGDSDLSGRNLAQHAPKYLGKQPIVAINRVGASGAIGSVAVKNASPDGYTLLIARIASHAILPAMDTKTPYKWNEFTFLSLLELNPFVCIVKSDSPSKTMQDLVATIRKNPGKLNFSTSGIGTIQNFGATREASSTGVSPIAAGSRCWLNLPSSMSAPCDLLQLTFNCCTIALMNCAKIHYLCEKGAPT
jgi:tripartite-type tricarboxylate transporter receptor subunit TctC